MKYSLKYSLCFVANHKLRSSRKNLNDTWGKKKKLKISFYVRCQRAPFMQDAHSKVRQEKRGRQSLEEDRVCVQNGGPTRF